MLSKMRLGTEVIGKSVAHGSWLSTSETNATVYGQHNGNSVNIFFLDGAYLQINRDS